MFEENQIRHTSSNIFVEATANLFLRPCRHPIAELADSRNSEARFMYCAQCSHCRKFTNLFKNWGIEKLRDDAPFYARFRRQCMHFRKSQGNSAFWHSALVYLFGLLHRCMIYD